MCIIRYVLYSTRTICSPLSAFDSVSINVFYQDRATTLHTRCSLYQSHYATCCGLSEPNRATTLLVAVSLRQPEPLCYTRVAVCLSQTEPLHYTLVAISLSQTEPLHYTLVAISLSQQKDNPSPHLTVECHQSAGPYNCARLVGCEAAVTINGGNLNQDHLSGRSWME